MTGSHEGPRHIESSINTILGSLLQRMLPQYEVRSEQTKTFFDFPGRHADILITAPGRSPVVIEAEYEPATSVEQEAFERLGLKVHGQPRTVEAAIAVRYPQALAQAMHLAESLPQIQLSYAVQYHDQTRFPESGWLDGKVTDIAEMVRLVSVSQKDIDQAVTFIEYGIDQATDIIADMTKQRPYITQRVATLLGMQDVLQTRRMACAILINAMLFHQRIAGMHQNILPLHFVCGHSIVNPQRETLHAWQDILQINYWSIFAIAKDILEQLPTDIAAAVLRVLFETAEDIEALGVENSHGLTGHIFQRLIADRKYLATFYTLPASAALLARLALDKMQNVDWGDINALGKLRIADFACGTGALLSAVYEQIATRHEHAGGDAVDIHPALMEDVLYGCDVMPSAVHVTGATLSGKQPSIAFQHSRLYTMPYGRQQDGSVAIGSLELLQSSTALTLFNMSDPAMRADSVGETTASQILAEFPDKTYDIVIMNPPFTSNTKHFNASDGIVNAAFAAYESSDDDQMDMANRLKQVATGTSYHGHAGQGSAFAALADRKVKHNGIVAFVLPYTFVNGPSWAKLRDLIANKYTDVTIISIASTGTEMSFSSDTDIAEVLLMARKKQVPTQQLGCRAEFVSLTKKPSSFASSLLAAHSITSTPRLRRLEDGPFGGTPIYEGDAVIGEMLDAPITTHKEGWGATRIYDGSVSQVAHALSEGRIWLPTESESRRLPMRRLAEIGWRGLDSQMFISKSHRGPFTKASASVTATFPSLWGHNARNESRLICKPDSQLQVRPGMETKATSMWETSSRTHISRGFRFNSQPLAVALTELKSLGGRAWPNVIFPCERFDYMFSLWGNSTLGLLCYWWHSKIEMSGRGDITVTHVESLPILDFGALSDEQLSNAETIFSEFRDKEFKPAYLADIDPVRALLDRRVICDLLGFDGDVYEGVRRLAAKWCAEPSVHGGKSRAEFGHPVM